eukprot:2104176-Rhodomonas_salina.2
MASSSTEPVQAPAATPASRTYVNSTYTYVKSIWTSVQEKYPRTQFITKRIEGVLSFSVSVVGYKTLQALDDWVISKTQTVDSVVDRVLTVVVPKSLANRQLSFSITGIFSYFTGCIFYFVPSFLKSKKQKVAVKEHAQITATAQPRTVDAKKEEEPTTITEKKQEKLEKQEFPP